MKKKNLLLASVLILILGFSVTVMGHQFKKLESFTKLPDDKQALVIETIEAVHNKTGNYGSRQKK